MSASMSQKIQAQASSLRMHEETKVVPMQGIVTILGSESERNRATATSLRLRRTLSADMSSKKWLSQNGFTPMKRIASSEDLSQSKIIPGSFPYEEQEEEEERKELESEASERGQVDIWSSIQRDKNKDQEQPDRFDIWSCILSQKSNEESSKSLPPPYVHPLVKRSQSSLSEKSLKICTESLGSETGSDVLSSYPPSETDEDKEEEQEQEQKVTVEAYEAEKEEEKQEFQVPKYNCTPSTKKSSPCSFPPPLPSLYRQNGPSLHMRSRRDDGRLVLEAVSLPSHSNFSAQRQDGRLVLTFANHQDSKEQDAVQVVDEAEKDHTKEDSAEEFVGSEEEDEFEDDETEEEEEGEAVIEQATMVPSGITSVHRLALMMNKPIGLVNTSSSPNWSEKLNQVVNLEDVNVVNRPRVARLISPAPEMASASSFNVYEYYWRAKPTGTAKPNPLTLQKNYNSCSLNNNSSELIVSGGMNPELVVLRGKNGDYLVHNLKSCKESRRSSLFWEPSCIATS